MRRFLPSPTLEGLPLLVVAAVVAALALGLAVQLAAPSVQGSADAAPAQAERLRLAEQSAAVREQLLAAR